MSPSATSDQTLQDQIVIKAFGQGVNSTTGHIRKKTAPGLPNGMKRTAFLLDRNLHKDFPVVVGGKGNYLFTQDGRKVMDSTGGAAVSCLGYGNERVNNAVYHQMKTGISYLASGYWSCEVVEDLCKELIDGTDGKMERVYLTGSGLSPNLEPTVIDVANKNRFGGHGGHNQACEAILL